MTRQELIRQLIDEYAERRRNQEYARDQREREILQKDPEIAALKAESMSLISSAVRAMTGGIDRAALEKAAEHVKTRGQEISREIAARLTALGYPENHLSVQYVCPLCRDTGYVGDAPARFCDCFARELSRRLHEDGSMAGTAEQNFEMFDETIFPEENGQRRQAIAARNYCEKYADAFPTTAKKNLLLMGEGGLGKTFLLNCIYERVIIRGFTAVRVTAFRLQDAMRERHMGESGGAFASLLEVPLLLIDDLGTEPMLHNITIEYLFTLFNERSAAGRHTVIATNLTPPQFKDRYGERVASRILDKIHGDVILLTGKDVRFQ